MNEKDMNEEMMEMMDTTELKESLLHGEWIEEAKQIPFYEVTDYERELLMKCINEKPFNPTELHDLEMLLGRFRGALEKYEPVETLEAVDTNIQLVHDEKEILRMMQESREEQILPFNYPLSPDVTIRYELIVMNEIDAEALDSLQQNLELFSDLTQDELELYQDYNDGAPQTPEEAAIAEAIAHRIEQKGMQNASMVRQTAIDFLAKQTRINGDPDSSEQGMRDIYSAMKLGYLMALFEKVQSMVGVTNIETEDLFR